MPSGSPVNLDISHIVRDRGYFAAARSATDDVGRYSRTGLALVLQKIPFFY